VIDAARAGIGGDQALGQFVECQSHGGSIPAETPAMQVIRRSPRMAVASGLSSSAFALLAEILAEILDGRVGQVSLRQQ